MTRVSLTSIDTFVIRKIGKTVSSMNKELITEVCSKTKDQVTLKVNEFRLWRIIHALF